MDDQARPAIEEELSALLVQTLAKREAWQRSAVANVVVTLTATLIAIGPSVPGAALVLGRITQAEATWLAAVLWGTFESATLAFHILGRAHALTRLLSALDAFVRASAVFVLLYLSGSAASPLWVVAMMQSFAWSAKPPRDAAADFVRFVASHAVLAVAFFFTTDAADAWLTMLVLLASTIGHTMTARMLARSARVRAERDVIERDLRETKLRQDRERMARELHDGVGADVTALVLRLERLAERGGRPNAARLAGRARGLLDELRGVVWSLRNEQGRLAELGKLIDATCRGVRGDVAYERRTPVTMAKERVGPRTALTALRVARELVKCASAEGASRVVLTLHVTGQANATRGSHVSNALELTVDGDGADLAMATSEGLRASFDDVKRTFGELLDITIGPLPEGEGARMRATIAMTPAGEATFSF